MTNRVYIKLSEGRDSTSHEIRTTTVSLESTELTVTHTKGVSTIISFSLPDNPQKSEIQKAIAELSDILLSLDI